MLDLWIKTIGKTFYRQHIGFFLFVFYLVFGAVEPSQIASFQLSLLYSISSSTAAAAGFCFILLLYALKTGAFVHQQRVLPTHQFVLESAALPTNQQIKRWLKLYIFLLCPMLVYTSMIILAGLYSGNILIVIGIAIWSMGIIIALSAASYRQVHRASAQQTKKIQLVHAPLKMPFYSWRIFYLIKQQPVLLVACKIISFLLLKGIAWMLIDTEGNEKYYIGLLAVVLSHSILVATILKFERAQLAFTHSLPINHWERIGGLLMFFLIVCIPELLVYADFVGMNLLSIGIGISYCLAGLSACYFLLYVVDDNMERYLYNMFIFFILNMLAILFGWLFAASLFVIATSVIYHRYLFRNARI